MKKILISLTLLLTISIASTDVPNATNAENINILTKGQVVLREARENRELRTLRSTRESREISTIKIEKIKKLSSLPLTRESRKIRENRFVVKTTRESRKIHHILVQDKLHFASLK